MLPSSTPTASPHPPVQEVFIIGPDIPRNRLLGQFLEKKTAVKCTCRKKMRPEDLGNGHHGACRVCLFDCQDHHDAAAKDFFGGRLFSEKNILPVFFNVVSDEALENIVKREKIRGVFYYNDSIDLFLKGMQVIHEGRLWLSRQMISRCINGPAATDEKGEAALKRLTRREKEILKHVASGKGNKEIADALNLSLHTVKTHLYNIFKKIEVPNRLQATLWTATYLGEQ